MIAVTFRLANPADFEALRQRLRNPDAIKSAMRSVMGAAANMAYNVARKGMKGRGQQRAYGTIFRRYDADTARVWTLIDPVRSVRIDRGRQPGQAVRLHVIRQWARAVGFTGDIFALRERLVTRGSRGTVFTDEARQRVEAALPSLVQEAGDRAAKKYITGR